MATPPALLVLEHELLLYRRVWRGSIFSSFLNPVLFLAAMGVGLGSYVSQHAGTAGASTGGTATALGGVSYLVFIAPGLLASTAMQAAAGDRPSRSSAASCGTAPSSGCSRRRSGSTTCCSARSRISASG